MVRLSGDSSSSSLFSPNHQTSFPGLVWKLKRDPSALKMHQRSWPHGGRRPGTAPRTSAFGGWRCPGGDTGPIRSQHFGSSSEDAGKVSPTSHLPLSGCGRSAARSRCSSWCWWRRTPQAWRRFLGRSWRRGRPRPPRTAARSGTAGRLSWSSLWGGIRAVSGSGQTRCDWLVWTKLTAHLSPAQVLMLTDECLSLTILPW